MARAVAKERFPSQSIFALMRTPISFSFMYAQMVPKTPIGTFARNTQRTTSESSPPTRMPKKEPKIAATMLIPEGKAELSWGEGVGDDRRRVRYQQRPADGLEDPQDDELQGRSGARAPDHREQDRPNGEPGEAEVVHPHPPNMSPMRPTVTTTAADTSM